MEKRIPPDYEALRAKVAELAEGPKDRATVEAKLKKLSSEGIPKKMVDPGEVVAKRQEIIERVQKKAEEYEQVTQSCAKSSALALMEEFGFGNMAIIAALSAFPGVAITGETCGAVLGGLAAISSYFGSDDLLDYNANARCYAHCRKFISRFRSELGTTKCREIHEGIVFGHYHDVADPEKGYPAFLEDKGFEKCALAPGIGARLAAQIILEDIEKRGKPRTG
jgi:C_GCAxxG_C_C family probable redox protein